MSDSSAPKTRLPLFLTGWRYIATPEEANQLPSSSIAVVDDAYLWDADCDMDSGTFTPQLHPDAWDGVVEVALSDRIHNCERGWKNCEQYKCRILWFEPDDHQGQPLPPLPFFAWHPTFCGGDA